MPHSVATYNTVSICSRHLSKEELLVVERGEGHIARCVCEHGSENITNNGHCDVCIPVSNPWGSWVGVAYRYLKLEVNIK
ncbi:hypothetical protein DPMN_036528 [Dreissena polymorpha]|uniref:Uncharacterized protein n=1 Tax=Dreissena polymorpha TaxID=45954 RepID=A0A9D4MDR2_DREPO|nr:hypothetical protein DPMN_036528 [Dreissena polymorpha]